MTANDIFKTACSYLSQTVEDSEDLAGLAPVWLSALLAESLPWENALRQYQGLPALAAAPVVESLDQTLDWRPALVRVALPYGLAAQRYLEEDDDYSARAQDMRGRYVNALAEALRLRPGEVRDVYA